MQYIWAPLDKSDLSVTVVTMVSKKNDLNRKRSWLGVTTQLPSQLQTDLDASDLSVTNVTIISKSWKKQLKKLPLPYDINPNCSWRLTPAVNVAPNVTFNASDCLRDAFKKHTGPGQHPCLQKGSHSFICKIQYANCKSIIGNDVKCWHYLTDIYALCSQSIVLYSFALSSKYVLCMQTMQ